MSNSKKIFVIACALMLCTISIVQADEPPTYNQYLNIGCTDIPDCVRKLFDGIVKLAVPAATIFIIIAGFMFVTAGGDPKKLDTAKKTLTWTIIGVAIAIAAWTLAIAFQTFFEQL